ncbi:MAG: helix-turn-helix domain containing protein [Deltaproteobacteria bacterium]|jgi:hypothetical protein|nr:helix-turn-helix domain containing protein [Deltaproteobacteria bacterium]
MNAPLTRVFEAANCRTQEELAGLLGIRQSAISDAKRRGSVPSEWLVCLFRLRNVNPEWVLTGCGPRFLDKGNGQDQPTHVERRIKPTMDMLRHFSSKALADELVRRSSTPACHSKKVQA